MGTLIDRAKSVIFLIPGVRGIARQLVTSVFQQEVSKDYRQLTDVRIARVAEELVDAWKSKEIPARQRLLVDTQLAAYRGGNPNPVFDALVDILTRNLPDINAMSLLEVGCSSGYYSEVLRIKNIKAEYTGCDFSAAFIEQARLCYPEVRFDIEDATALSYPESFFDVVVSGCCILHIVDYSRAIAEAARVASEYVIFHRTPVLHKSGPMFYQKMAYGVETVEIHFNEQDLVELFARHGLAVIDINTHSLSWDPERLDALAMKTYLCRKAIKAVRGEQ